jgi:hypothetical protein
MTKIAFAVGILVVIISLLRLVETRVLRCANCGNTRHEYITYGWRPKVGGWVCGRCGRVY